jgi:hypothetical protein
VRPKLDTFGSLQVSHSPGGGYTLHTRSGDWFFTVSPGVGVIFKDGELLPFAALPPGFERELDLERLAHSTPALDTQEARLALRQLAHTTTKRGLVKRLELFVQVARCYQALGRKPSLWDVVELLGTSTTKRSTEAGSRSRPRSRDTPAHVAARTFIAARLDAGKSVTAQQVQLHLHTKKDAQGRQLSLSDKPLNRLIREAKEERGL